MIEVQEVLTTLLCCSKTVGQYTLTISLVIGEFLFELISKVVIQSNTILAYMVTAAQVVLKELGLYLQGIPSIYTSNYDLIYKSVDSILSSFIIVANSITSIIQTCIYSIGSVVPYIINTYYNIGATIIVFLLPGAKKMLILLGSGLWFAITLVPVAIFSGSVLFWYCIGVILEVMISLLDGIKRMAMFFIDIPLAGAVGIFLLVGLVYTINKYYAIHRRHDGTILEISVNNTRKEIQEIDKPQDKHVDKGELSQLSECIVCQSKPKCMLIFPCKHVCTCKDCMQEIKRICRKCPVCRTRIDSAIFIYI